MLKLDNVSVSIHAVQILRAVNLELRAGTMAGLIGRNGAGKTTLMRAVMGFLPMGGGALRFDGADMSHASPQQRARLGIGYMPEDRRLIPDLSVMENLLLPSWATGERATRLELIYGLIPELEQFTRRKAAQLSGGQQKLVALGRALMSGRKLLLLDEPFEGVAPALRDRLIEVVEGLKRAGLTVLLSESDLQHSERILERVFRIDRGEVSALQ